MFQYGFTFNSFFDRTLLALRAQYGMLDDGARFHVISHLILETVSCGKSMLATSIMGRDDSVEVSSNIKEAGFIYNLIQRDRVLASVCHRFFFLTILVVCTCSEFMFELFTSQDLLPYVRNMVGDNAFHNAENTIKYLIIMS